MDIQPVNPGHLLVVPRRHGPLMQDFDESTAAHVWLVAMRMGEALRSSGVRCEGINLLVPDGEAAFQDIPHFHVHVIPRYIGDGFGLTFPPGYENMPARAELDVIAQHVRAATEVVAGKAV